MNRFNCGVHIGKLAAVLCMALAGCAQGPAVLVDTPTGVTPIYTPPPAMPGAVAALPAPAAMVTRTGSYTGTAVPLDTGGGICINTLTVSNFRVDGNAVRFGRFRGTIGPDNGLQMVSGDQWIVGQFEGASFHGQFDVPGPRDAPGCTFMLTLRRTGP